MSDNVKPDIVIIWDPEVITEDEYASIVAAIGDIVRASGGIGIARISSRTITVNVEKPVSPSKPMDDNR
jgi:hypothetical protein